MEKLHSILNGHLGSRFSPSCCSICSSSMEKGNGQAIFTVECSHSFHFNCIITSYLKGQGNHQVCPVWNVKWTEIPLQYGFNDDESLDAQTQSKQSFSENEPSTMKLKTYKEFLAISHSMQGSKIALLKPAMGFLIQNLGPNDRLPVIAFSDTARRLFPLSRMYESGKQQALQSVNLLEADGTTNIADGLSMGAKVLEDSRYKNTCIGGLLRVVVKELQVNIECVDARVSLRDETALLKVKCDYIDPLTKEMVTVRSEEVRIRRPKEVGHQDVSVEVDRQQRRLEAVEATALDFKII
ncbi:OLC1v1017591C1 [Oldenlandia corymbosa var. corymbosa]|uniref:OLC1v1017591C1 n=1 Tax=Oldenlandia corymbosa var. corymbosa TaxID=529605 RepID=A0AAV1E9R7_OLDCO|nr:OLC1v1017591C1 [Oldenlandia corymbosa var. corymbosa]